MELTNTSIIAPILDGSGGGGGVVPPVPGEFNIHSSSGEVSVITATEGDYDLGVAKIRPAVLKNVVPNVSGDDKEIHHSLDVDGATVQLNSTVNPKKLAERFTSDINGEVGTIDTHMLTDGSGATKINQNVNMHTLNDRLIAGDNITLEYVPGTKPTNGKIKIDAAGAAVPRSLKSTTGELSIETDDTDHSYDLGIVRLNPEVVKETFSDTDENDLWIGNDPANNKLVAKIKSGGSLRKTIHDDLFDKTSEKGPIIQHSPAETDYDNSVKIVAGGTAGSEYVIFTHRHQAIVKSLIHGNAISGDVTAIGRYAGNNTKLELTVGDMVKGSKVKVSDDDWISKDWDSVNRALTLKVQPTKEQLLEMLDDGKNITFEDSSENIDDSHPERGKKIKISAAGGGTGSITAGQLQALIDQSGEVKSKVVGNAVTLEMDRASLKNHIFSQEEAHNPILKPSDDINVKAKGSDNYELEIKPTSPAVEKAKVYFTNKITGQKKQVIELAEGNGTSFVEAAGKVTITSTSNINVHTSSGGEEVVKPIESIYIDGDDITHTVVEKKLFLHGVTAYKKAGSSFVELGVIKGIKPGSGVTIEDVMVGGKRSGDVKINAKPEIAVNNSGDLKSVYQINLPENTGEFQESNRQIKLNGVQATAGGNTKHIKQITVVNNSTVTTSSVTGDGTLTINIPPAGGGTPTPGTNRIEVTDGTQTFSADKMSFDASFLLSQVSEGSKVVAKLKNKGILATGPDSALQIDTQALKIDGGGVKLKQEGSGEVSKIAHYEIKTPVHGNKKDGTAIGKGFDRITFDNKHFTVTEDTTTVAGLTIADVAFLHDIDSVFLGCFDSSTALKAAAAEVDVPFKAGRIVGLLRKALAGDSAKTKGFEVWKWSNTSISKPSDTDCKNDNNWDKTTTLSADEYGVKELGKGSGGTTENWKPTTAGESEYPANKHKGQIVWYTKQDGTEEDTGHYWSNGTSWEKMASGPNIQVTGFDAESAQIGKTANKIDFGRNLVATVKGTGSNQFMSIDSRGMTVAQKDASTGTTGIHSLEFEGATVTAGVAGSGMAKIKITGGGGELTYKCDGSADKKFTAIKSSGNHPFVTDAGELQIGDQAFTFLGFYEDVNALKTAAKQYKPFLSNVHSYGLVRKSTSASASDTAYYSVHMWKSGKGPTEVTDDDVMSDDSWETKDTFASHGHSILCVGTGTSYADWTPTSTDKEPLASKYKGQFVYCLTESTKGHYYSDGTNWAKISTGGGTGAHLTVTGFKEDENTETTIDNVTSIKFTGGFIKGTSGSNLELISGIQTKVTGTGSGGEKTEGTVKKIEVTGDPSMFNIGDDNELNLKIWNTANATSKDQLQSDHPAASNPGRMGYTTGSANELYVVNRTNSAWEMVGRKDLPKDFDALYKRFPETIAEVSNYTEKKETGYVFVNQENVRKSTTDGGLGLTKGDQGVLLNLYTGTGQRWVQMFYEMTNNNVWSRSHGQGTGSSSGTWNSWQQVSGVDDGCYSVLTIDNDKTAKDVSDANYKMPYMISQDPRANIIPTNENGDFKVRRTGKYNINCVAQFTWEAKNIPAETPATTGALMGIYEDSVEKWKLEITENVYDATKKEFHPLKGEFKEVLLQEGKTYHVVVALTRASSEEKSMLELDPYKNMISIDPSNSDSKTGFRIMNNLYRSLGGISFGTGNEVRVEEKDGSIRVFGEPYLTTFKTLTKPDDV